MNTPIVHYIHTPTTHNTRAAEAFLPILFGEIGVPQSVVDVGCGTGTWLSVFKAKGVSKILGVDGSNVDLAQLHIDPSEFRALDLTQPVCLAEKFDLAVCLEVAEHLPEVSSDTLVDSLCRFSDTILFSAALPQQGGQNHINEQSFDYWREKFNRRGYLWKDVFRTTIWNDPRIDSWYRQNMFLIEKVGESPVSQEPIDVYYHPESYYYQAYHHARTASSNEKIVQGRIPVLSALKILFRSVMFSLSTLFRPH